MKKKWMVTVTLLLLLSVSRTGFAEEAKENATKIDRVRWSGLSLGGWKILGSWATAPIEPSLFGTASPYFRLDGDDKTVFRGLGRESSVVQYILPTLHSRRQLRDIMGINETARQSLDKFDSQVATGEKIQMVSNSLVFGGKIGIVSGTVMMFLGLGEASGTVKGETPVIMKAGYNIAIVGISSWFAGRIGQLAGEIVAKQSFGHLNDAVTYYNTGSQ